MRLPAIVAILAVAAGAAHATTLDRVRTAGAVRCGGAPGFGLATPAADGEWHGLLVDMCRAVSVAVLGAPGRVVFRPYLRDTDYAAAPGGDDIVFLTPGDLVAHDLLAALAPGPPVYYRTIGLMVEDPSPVRTAADLGGAGVCFEPGTPADRALDTYFAQHHLPPHPMPFQETDEMVDAFADHLCAAVAGEVTALAGLGDVGRIRILPDVLAATPLLAATALDDGRWSAAVAWTVATLLRAEANGAAPAPDRPMARLPITASALGLAAGWQARVVAATGDYAAIYHRNFGDARARGPNALHEQGGLLLAPATE